MSSQPTHPNPYESPVAVTETRPGEIDDEMLRSLERPIRWYPPILGTLWIITGVCGTSLAAVIFGKNYSPQEVVALAVALLGFGAIPLIAGVLTCFRRLWAVRIGLVGSYVALGLSLPALFAGLWIPAIVFGACVLMAHRFLSYSQQLSQLRSQAPKRRQLIIADEPPT